MRRFVAVLAIASGLGLIVVTFATSAAILRALAAGSGAVFMT
jgi:hypothetical protein